MMASIGPLRHLLRPGVDVALGEGHAPPLAAHVMGERAAAAGAGRDHDVDAAAREQADGGVVDAGAQHLLRAAGKQQTRARGARRSVSAVPGPSNLRRGGSTRGASSIMAASSFKPTRRRSDANGRPSGASLQRQAEAARIGEHAASSLRTQRSLKLRGPRLLDVGARKIDQMHVVDAARAGRHAGQARQAAVDVGLHLGGWRRVRPPACP